MDNNKITITKAEYDRLIYARDFLNCLEACGVDNWDGYYEAHEMMDGEDEE